MCACPERTTLHGSTRCEENSGEHCSDVHRFLALLGFPTEAWRSVAGSWFRHRRSCFRSYRANLPAGSESSVCVSLAAGVHTTSTQDGFLEIVKLACCVVRVCETAFPWYLWRRRSRRLQCRRVCCSLSRRTWLGVSREVHHCVASVCDVRVASLGLDVQVCFFFELGVRRKWTDFQVFEPLVFLVRVRGTTLHGGLVVRRSLSQSLRFFFFSVASSTQSQRCSRCAATSRSVSCSATVVQEDSGRQ